MEEEEALVLNTIDVSAALSLWRVFFLLASCLLGQLPFLQATSLTFAGLDAFDGYFNAIGSSL